MKKILYILTSLILILPNISFGQLQVFCTKPIILTTQTSYPVGSNLSLEVIQFVNEGSTNSTNKLYISFLGPNEYSTGNFEVINEQDSYNVRNNLTLADSGWYYATFTQVGCATTVDSIYITLTSGLKLPFTDNFDEMKKNYNYPNWTFSGPYNDSLSKSNWESVIDVSPNILYGSLIHFADSVATPDSAMSPIFLINDTIEKNAGKDLIMKFDYAHLLRDSTSDIYDTLIVKAYVGNNPTPIQLFKKGGVELATNTRLDTTHSFFMPPIDNTNLWKRVQFNLKDYDTASTIKFLFILKPSSYLFYETPSNNLLLTHFKVRYKPNVDNMIAPTISVDSVLNRDRIHRVTVSLSNNHNARVCNLYEKTKNGTNLLVTRFFQTNSDTAYTFTHTDSVAPNFNKHYVASTVDSTYETEKFSQEIIVKTNFTYPPVGTARLDVDSSFNKDRQYKLLLYLPPDHNSDVIKFYDGDSTIKITQINDVGPSRGYYEKTSPTDSIFINTEDDSLLNISRGTNIINPLFRTDDIKISNLTGGFKLIEYTKTNVLPGVYAHSAAIGNTRLGEFSVYNDESLNLVNTSTVSVTVDTVTTPVSTPSVSIDRNTTSNGIFNITISLPTRHNATMYEIKQNGNVIYSDLILTNDRFLETIQFTGKTSGTYTYTVTVSNSTNSITTSNITLVSTYVPPPVVIASACTTNTLTAPNRVKSNFTYSFTLNPNCPITSYKALFYSGQFTNGLSPNNQSLSQAQLNSLTWKPEGGSPRNSGYTNGNIKFTAAELNSKVFTRVASPLPALSNRWYKVEILCTTCSQTNKKRVGYFFVTN